MRCRNLELELANNLGRSGANSALDCRRTNPGAGHCQKPVCCTQIEADLPADAPFAQIRAVGGDQNPGVEMIRDALFDRKVRAAKGGRD